MSKVSLANYLHDRLNAMQISNKELARRALISRQTWYKLLNAEIEEARLSTLIRVSAALNTHIINLLNIYYSGHNFSPSSTHADSSTKLSSGFVADITYPVNSCVFVGETFTKTWRIINIERKEWKDRYLSCTDEHSKKITPYLLKPESFSLQIPNLKPGESIDLSVSFKAPLTPGTVLSEWKVTNISGQVLDTYHPITLRCIVKVVSI